MQPDESAHSLKQSEIGFQQKIGNSARRWFLFDLEINDKYTCALKHITTIYQGIFR